MEIGEIDPGVFPWDISEAAGEIRSAEILCPGVYYVSTFGIRDGGTEFYVVDARTDAVSNAAKAYGQRAEGIPDCLLYPFERRNGGRRIIEYEIQRYYIIQV